MHGHKLENWDKREKLTWGWKAGQGEMKFKAYKCKTWSSGRIVEVEISSS